MRNGGTRVMTLGQVQPEIRQQTMWPTPSYDQPQNLLRATLQNGPHALSGGLGDAMNMASLGRVGRMLAGGGSRGLGQTPPTDSLGPPAGPGSYEDSNGMGNLPMGWALVSTASMGASAYHGYARNKSVPWAIWWGLMGAMFPVITPAIGLAQGWGQRAR